VGVGPGIVAVGVGPGWVAVGVGPGTVAVGVGGGGVPPPHTSPFKTKVGGTTTLPLCVPWKPKATVPPLAPIVPFQCPAGLEAVTLLPEVAKLAFQPAPNASLPAKAQVSDQPLTAVLSLFVIVTSAWKPLPHWFTML